MADPFDPYHRWLGIPPDEQPPNHYRLLGVRLFEDDGDVIESAADRQMGHLRTYQSGPHSAVSQRLLNEVAAARICLLEPRRRAAYDAQLRQQRVAQLVPPPLVAPPPISDRPAPSSVDGDLAGMIAQAEEAGNGARLRRVPIGSVIAAGAVAMMLGAGLLMWAKLSQTPMGPETVARETDSVPGEPAKPTDSTPPPKPTPKPPPKPAPQKPALPKPAQPKSSQPGPVAPTKPVELNQPDEDAAGPDVDQPMPRAKRGRRVKAMLSDPGSAVPVVEPVPPSVMGPEMPATRIDTPEVRPSAAKLAPPTAAEQQKALRTIEDIYRNDMQRAKTPLELKALAEKLIEQGQETTDDPAGRFVLWKMARDVATQAGAGLTAFDAVDATARAYDVDVVAWKADVLLRCGRMARTPAQYQLVVDTARPLIEQALAERKIAAAQQLCELAINKARQLHSGAPLKALLALNKRIKDAQAGQTELDKALAALKAQPDDPAVNLAAGRLLCTIRGDWQQGLPCLAKGNDPALGALARQETTAPPTAAEEQAKLGDAWWELAQQKNGLEKDAILLHAGAWYKQARPNLPGGLARAKVDSRLAEVAALEGTSKPDEPAKEEF